MPKNILPAKRAFGTKKINTAPINTNAIPIIAITKLFLILSFSIISLKCLCCLKILYHIFVGGKLNPFQNITFYFLRCSFVFCPAIFVRVVGIDIKISAVCFYSDGVIHIGTVNSASF